MKRMNLGCGYDIKDGWVNTDAVYRPEYHDIVDIWNATAGLYWDYADFDFILINHVLCTMKPDDVMKVLKNCHEMLKPGGAIHIIDMDLLKVFHAYENGDSDSIPIETGDIDSKLCYAISGYGTRLSLYTDRHLQNLLIDAGFRSAVGLDISEHDTRPLESLIVEGTK